MKNKLKLYTFHSIWILILTILICVFVKALSFSTMFLDPIGQALNGFRFTDTYFYVQNADTKTSDYNPDILLFDISNCYSRTEIAAALQRISDLKPKAIGMDVIFGQGGVQDSISNDSLIRVVQRSPKLVTAMRVIQSQNGFSLERSFFADTTKCSEACVNVENETVRTFGSTVTVGNLTLPSFAGEIVKMAYPDMYDDFVKRGNKTELINYKALSFDKIHIYEPFDTFDIEDRIVLIGDFEDLRDFHGVPAMIDGSRRIPGTTIHAYAISTVTKDRLINQMTDTEGLLIGIALTFLFSIVCARTFLKYDKVSGLLVNVWQLILLFFLTIIGGIAFLRWNTNLNLLYAMLGTGLVGFTADLWFCFSITKIYKNTFGRIEPKIK